MDLIRPSLRVVLIARKSVLIATMGSARNAMVMESCSIIMGENMTNALPAWEGESFEFVTGRDISVIERGAGNV